MLVDHVLDAVGLVLRIDMQERVMDWSRRALQSGVRIQIEVPLKRRRHISLNQTPRKRVAFSITHPRGRETPDMVTLSSNNDRELAIPGARVAETAEDSFDVGHFGIHDVEVLALRHTIAEVIDLSRKCASANIRLPL